MRNACSVVVGKTEGRVQLEHLGVYENITSKWISSMYSVCDNWTGFIWLGLGANAGLLRTTR
jgi:hypothetical protein